MIFKEPVSMMADWSKVHPLLKKVLAMLDTRSQAICGKEIVVTSLFRPPSSIKKSWHPVGCAADIRVHYFDVATSSYEMLHTQEQLDDFEQLIKSLNKFSKIKIDFVPHLELRNTPQAHLHIEVEAYNEGLSPA